MIGVHVGRLEREREIQSNGFGLGHILIHIIILGRKLLELIKHGEMVHHSRFFIDKIFLPPKILRGLVLVNGAIACVGGKMRRSR